ncbi:hypothetical protein GCK32_003063 [Trichostrongylus colubriformis]|uniref:Uncharacterized protein n=1 Tax=Trichostrongylus colubriformis TaxID=6319 RepID=A0AAN8F612_TRICO
MQPRRQSMDSETSSDSWSVIQKNVSQQEIQEISSAEIDFVSSDSEHWDSDSAQDPHEYDTNEDGGNDSLEECDESDGVDEESDCEIVDENEAMQETSARYFVSSEKVYELLDMLNAECCTSMGELMIWSRDSTRAAVLLVFIVTTAIFFTSSIRIGRTRSTADRSDEIFASGLQSRKDFERAFMPVLPRRASFNFSEVVRK